MRGKILSSLVPKLPSKIQMKRIRTGDVVLFNHDHSFFSRQITKYNLREYGQSKCTHAGIVSRTEGEKVWIFEIVNYKTADHQKYKREWLNKKAKDGKIIIKRSRRLVGVFGRCNKYIGKSYSILDILSIYLYGMTGIKLSLTKKRRVICSELTARILYESSKKKVNFEPEFKKPYDLITPMDLYLSKQLKKI